MKIENEAMEKRIMSSSLEAPPGKADKPKKTPVRSQKNNPPCPNCGAKTACKEAPVPAKKGGWRRRRTYICSMHPKNAAHQFVTDEKYTLGGPMLLIKSDGRKAAFEFDSLVEGLSRAATPGERQSLVFQIARKVTTEVEAAARVRWAREKRAAPTTAKLPETTSAEVGQTVLRILKDELRFSMWIRFALIHKKLDKDARRINEVLDGLWKEWDAGPAWEGK